MTHVVAIVPAKDRSDSVAATATALLALPGVDQVVVVDDGSTDDTSNRAHQSGARVLRLGSNRGKGAAVAAAVAATPDADVYLLIDADVGTFAAEASALLQPVLDDDADLTIGVLPPAGTRGGFGTIRKFSTWGIRRASGFEARAPLSGQRAVRAQYLRELTSAGRFGLEVAMTIDAVRAGARVVEIDVAMDHRHTGRSVSGFRHRGGQGIDIVSSLWPRLFSLRLRRAGLGLLLVLFVGLSYVTSASTIVATVPADGTVTKVVIFAVPQLALSDVDPSKMPALDRLSRQGAYGMMTIRTGGGSSSASAYAALGASALVRGFPTVGQAAERNEQYEGSPAIDVVARRTGVRPSGRVLVPAMSTARASAGANVDSLPGALGDALRAAHKRTAVVANSDTYNADGTVNRYAPASLALATRYGALTNGNVSPELLRHDPGRPFGVGVDDQAFMTAVQLAESRSDAVIVDPGETERASAAASTMTSSAAGANTAAAKRRTDVLIGRVANSLPAHTLLMVIGVSPPGSATELVPIVLTGAGVVPGNIESPSTNRPNLATLTDLAPTVLASLDVPVPPAMIGQPLRYRAGTVNRKAMNKSNELAKAWSAAYSPFTRSLINAQIVLYLIAVIALLRSDTPSMMKRLLRWLVLVVASLPIMTFVARAIPGVWHLGAEVDVVVWIGAAVAATAASRWRRHPLDPLLAIGLFAVALLSLDMALGAPLQVSSLLGYTPTSAARYGGMGNTAFAVLAAGVVIACTVLVARSSRPRDVWWLAVFIAAIAVIADGAPWLGSDVGGLLSLAPTMALVLYLLRGRRISVRLVAVVAGATVALLALVIGFEALQPADKRDHIGRFFLGGADSGTFWATISRKWATNMSLLTSSNWSQLIPVIGGFVVLILVIGRGWHRLLPAGSPERIGFFGLLLVALVGWATNDSGPLIAALVLVYVGPYVALLALRPAVPDDVMIEPTGLGHDEMALP